MEKRRELLGQLDTVETEYRAALTEEAEAEATQPDAQRDHSRGTRVPGAGVASAELRHAMRAVMDGKPLTGAAKELQEHRGLSGHDLPWEMVAPRPAPRAEHRADAVSPAPADSHLQQHGIIGRVFARSATMTLGVQMPQVAVGEQNYPVITTTDTAADSREGCGRNRLGRCGHYRARHRAGAPATLLRLPPRGPGRSLRSGGSAAERPEHGGLRSTRRDRFSPATVRPARSFGGFLATVRQRRALRTAATPPARVTFALAAGETARGIDGKYAGGLSECAVVIGDDTARDLASKFQNQDSDSALAYMGRTTMKTMASANVPAVASMFQEGVLARMGASGANADLPGLVEHVHDPRRNHRPEVRADCDYRRECWPASTSCAPTPTSVSSSRSPNRDVREVMGSVGPPRLPL